MIPNGKTAKNFPARESLAVEFKSDPKAGLADRTVVETAVGFTNAEGGTLYIGIDDNGTVSGLRTTRWNDPLRTEAIIASHTVPPISTVAELVEAEGGLKVLVVQIPKSTGIVATNDGKVLKRRIKIDGMPETSPLFPQEFISRLSEIGRCDYSNMIPSEGRLEDLDGTERLRLRRLLKNGGESLLLELEDEDLDKALGIVRGTPEGLKPTVAGLLVIGKAESVKRLVPGAGAVFQQLQGTDVLANEDMEVPLLKCFEALLDRFRARNTEVEVADGFERIAIPTYSERAYREALVNAFCHRDYTLLRRVSVRFGEDGLEITSPGGFVSGVSLENLLTAEPNPRNALLADIFKRLGLAERTGRGIDRIFEGSLIYGRPCPDYSESNEESVRVFFPKCEADAGFFTTILRFDRETGRNVSVQGLMALSAVRFSRRLTFGGISKATHLSDLKLRRHVEMLVEAKLLEASGNGRNRDYRLGSRFNEGSNVGRDISQEERILKLASAKGTVTRGDVVRLLAINTQAAYRLLRKMVAQGQLSREGDKRNSVYHAA